MATLEEAALAFTRQLVADVTERGKRMAWQRWPEQDHGTGTGQVIAFWMWPAAHPSPIPPTPPTDENPEEWGTTQGFWFELRHEGNDREACPEGYAEFTIFIEGGKWMYSFAVDHLAEQYSRDYRTP